MSGRLLLLPTLLGGTDPAQVLPQAALHAAQVTTHFLAENAKSARAFLKAIDHPGPIGALHISEIGHRPDVTSIDGWLAPARDSDTDVAIVSEAGCPGIADPGSSIVARAHAVGLRVVPLVGPSSLLLLLMAAGMNGQRFRFVGYLPRETAELAQAIRALEAASTGGETQLFIETPYRNERLLSALIENLQAATRLAVGVELTTARETVRSLSIGRWRALAPHERPPLAKRPAVFALQAETQSGTGR